MAADYDPIDHLNALFSHPSTLSSVSKTSKALRGYQDGLDKEIDALVAEQSMSDTQSLQRIQIAKDDLAELFSKIEGVQQRAMQTEQAITDMTADIKRLDNTKKNLTLSMTALKRLQMLTTAYEQLKGLSTSRQYRECASLLQAVIQLMTHFKTYRSIDQIATLSRNVSDVQRELLEQICEDFEVTFAKDQVQSRRAMLSEACLVMDALGDNARSRLITWYCNTQLREYRQVFKSEEAGSLDNISRRYAWFRRLLKTYDDHHAAIFPSYWRVDEVLANSFCEGTRDDFKGILAKSVRRTDGQTLDANLLLTCLQETLEFEHGLERKFGKSSRVSLDTVVSTDTPAAPFSHAISEAFEPYLGVWVEAQERQLASMLPKYRSQPPKPPEEDFNPQMVMPSSTELFGFYRTSFAQCAKLSTGAQLVELSKVFSRYLDQYAQQVLLSNITEKPGGGTPSRMPSLQDTVLVLNTADYCYTTSTQLEERIKSRIDESWKDFVDLSSQADAFMGIASAAIRALVRRVEVDIEPSWREMRNIAWGKLQNVEDQSPYVPEMVRHIKSRATEVLEAVHKQQYSRAFCDNVVELFASSYALNIVQCKPIPETAAEQMLLDSYAFTTELSSLMTLHDPTSQPPASYTKRVSTTMARISPLLKTLQVRPSPPESLVQAYLIHIADKSDTNFRKILDLKGVRRADQNSLMDLFQAHKQSPRHAELPAQNPFLTPLMAQGSSSSTAMSSISSATTQNLPSLPGRFDPTMLGSALMTAARDGVDRFGTPTLSSGSQSRTVSPPPPGASGLEGVGNVNRNLQNIGKFFKRDLGGFGGRFGGVKPEEQGRRGSTS
jgi:hypothetical protein